MDILNILSMIGGLSLFLYGMKILGDALSKLAGGKLEKVLEGMTNNKIKGVLLGAGVTAVIQSSSATTVMVVGFVNSGIMKLSQAISLIMGANIGTTITSWMLSLTRIDGEGLYMKLLKPENFSTVIAFMGIVLIMFAKSEKKKDIGTIMIGFAILMFGMDTMSDAVEPLSENEKFKSLFTMCENPFVGMFVGAAVTAIIQSSSASVGILQSACSTGRVSIGASVPIIMGQNIGTCITALISAVGASKNAKRASLVHLYFNLIGTTLFMMVFYSANLFLHFGFLDDVASQTTIAIIHTIFNISATLVLLPVSRLIEKLAYMTIPKTEEEDMVVQHKVLDERFLERPAFAVAQCKSAVCDVAQLVEKAMGLCVLGHSKYNEEYTSKIVEIEADVDTKEDELMAYLAKVSAKQLTEIDSKAIGMYGKCIIDWERMSDYAKGISYAQKKLESMNSSFSKDASKEAALMYEATLEIVETTVRCFIHDDVENAFRIEPLTDVISTMKKTIRKNHNKRLIKGECSIELGMSLIDIINSLERIAKHCSNIAEEEIAIVTDKFNMHQYSRDMKNNNELYKEWLEEYKSRFSIESLQETV